MHLLRRLAAFLVLAPPVSLLASTDALYGAPPVAAVAPQAPHGMSTWGATDLGNAGAAESSVVLVVIDGVRWQEIFGGVDHALAKQHGVSVAQWSTARSVVPNLQRMLDTGAVAIGAPGHGVEMSTAGSQRISLPSYREIFSGKSDAACQSNECALPPSRTIADDIYDASGPESVAVVSSWPTIARAASARPLRFVLTTGRKLTSQIDVLRSDPEIGSLLDVGARTAAFPGAGDYRPDAITSRLALRYLAVRRPRFLFVGLGDPDEYAHRNDYERYLESLHQADEFIGELEAQIDSTGARGRHTTVIVTTDHGRANNFRDHGVYHPESGRVWLVAGGGDVQTHGFANPAQKYTLADIAPTVRALLGLAPAGGGEPITEIVSR